MAGRDGRVFFSRRDGAVFFFSEAGRGGRFFFPKRDGAVVFFPRRDGAVVFIFRGGTGRGGCVFSAPGPGGCIFCSRRDGAVNGCCFQRRDGIVYTRAKRGGVTFCESVMVVHDKAPTVLPTGNDEDGTRKLQILAPCL